HARREWPEAFAKLDLEIHLRLHTRTARIADDAPIAKRARAELHSSIEPPNDLLVRDERGDFGDQRRAIRTTVLGVYRLEITLNLLRRIRGSEVGALHRVGMRHLGIVLG